VSSLWQRGQTLRTCRRLSSHHRTGCRMRARAARTLLVIDGITVTEECVVTNGTIPHPGMTFGAWSLSGPQTCDPGRRRCALRARCPRGSLRPPVRAVWFYRRSGQPGACMPLARCARSVRCPSLSVSLASAPGMWAASHWPCAKGTKLSCLSHVPLGSAPVAPIAQDRPPGHGPAKTGIAAGRTRGFLPMRSPAAAPNLRPRPTGVTEIAATGARKPGPGHRPAVTVHRPAVTAVPARPPTRRNPMPASPPARRFRAHPSTRTAQLPRNRTTTQGGPPTTPDLAPLPAGLADPAGRGRSGNGWWCALAGTPPARQPVP
jgi:hypothetical protein